jgi:hypothetical protein
MTSGAGRRARPNAAALLCTAALGACAPDAMHSSPTFDAFLDRVQTTCYYQRIGIVNLGDALTSPGSEWAGYFMDETSRLYYRKITPENWVMAITAFMQGRADDPGVRCVLDLLDKTPRPGIPQVLAAPARG